MRTFKKRKYTDEFKRQAVELADQLESASRAAAQLGIAEANVHNWRAKRNQSNKNDQPSTLEAETPEQENKRLRKENEELRKVNYILKRAAAFFSQGHLK